MAAGHQTRFIANNGATWGTLPETNPSTTTTVGMALREMPSMGGAREDSDPTGAAMEWASVANKGGISVGEITIPLKLAFSNNPRMGYLFGGDAVSGSGPYTHILTPSSNPQQRFMGGAFSVPNPDNAGAATAYVQLDSFAGTGFSIDWNIGQEVNWDIRVLARQISRQALTVGNVTYPANNSIITCAVGDSDCLTIADQGSAPANFGVIGGTFEWNTPREGGDHSTTSEYIGLPDRTGTGSGTLTLRVAGMIAATALSDFETPTAKNAVLTFPGRTVGGTAMTWECRFPHLVLKSFDPVGSGSGKTFHELVYHVFGDADGTADSAADTPAGEPWAIHVDNDESGDYDTAAA
ncbi:MAG: hypothetical protein B7733_07080 [Myxococcales bacterium FL481]|nr:MAG: hypothetical protein B7733_07080 [Myxococcales bacterium FL481]